MSVIYSAFWGAPIWIEHETAFRVFGRRARYARLLPSSRRMRRCSGVRRRHRLRRLHSVPMRRRRFIVLSLSFPLHKENRPQPYLSLILRNALAPRRLFIVLSLSSPPHKENRPPFYLSLIVRTVFSPHRQSIARNRSFGWHRKRLPATESNRAELRRQRTSDA